MGAPKTVRISNFCNKFTPQGQLVCSISTKLSTSVRVYRELLVWSLSGDKQPRYKHFPAVGASSLKFSIAPNGETTIGSKKLGGAKMGRTYSIIMPSMVVIVGRAPADVMFFVYLSVCLSRFMELRSCDNGNAVKQCNFQNNYGVTAQRKV